MKSQQNRIELVTRPADQQERPLGVQIQHRSVDHVVCRVKWAPTGPQVSPWVRRHPRRKVGHLCRIRGQRPIERYVGNRSENTDGRLNRFGSQLKFSQPKYIIETQGKFFIQEKFSSQFVLETRETTLASFSFKFGFLSYKETETRRFACYMLALFRVFGRFFGYSSQLEVFEFFWILFWLEFFFIWLEF